MRWWLAAAFALVAAVTALAVVLVLSHRSQRGFQASAVELAVGHAVVVAEAVSRAETPAELRRTLQAAALRRDVSLNVVGADGETMAAASRRGIRWSSLEDVDEAILAALSGARYIRATPDGSATLVAVRVLGGDEPRALLTYAVRPEVREQLGIVRDETVVAALWAVLVGGAVGFAVAQLIASRLRRIADAAGAIEAGSFDAPLDVRFPDEVGRLAASLDRMRVRLRESFTVLAADRDRLDRLLERLREGVVAVRADGTVDFGNEAAARILGVAALEPGDPLPEPWPSFRLGPLAGALFAPGAAAIQTDVRPSDGEAYSLAAIPPVEGGDSAVLVLVDLSDRERQERAQREFVTNAAHELRTPVTAILTSIELLQAGAKDEEEERDAFLAHIEEEAGRLARLTRALLVLSRAETGAAAIRRSEHRLRPLLEAVAASLSPAAGVRVHVDCPEELTASTDVDLLEQAVAAVGLNAAKYTEAGSIRLTARADGGATVVEVADTGQGIDAAEARNVFDRFYRVGDRDRDGFGLGLAIARQSVRLLEGTIDVGDRSGGGTVVTIRLQGADA